MTSSEATRTPAAEVEIDEALVRALLAEQHPDLAQLPLELAASGWDNATYRLGADAAVRLPRRALAADLVRNEQACLPALAAVLPLPVPAPTRAGVPSQRYPWHWSVLPWYDGEAADTHQPDSAEAGALGRFLRALHTPAPVWAPSNPSRGGPLAPRTGGVEERLGRLRAREVDVTPLVGTWRSAIAAAVFDGAPRWIHGDLHPRNVLVADGELAAIIDWGDVTAGDPATDLAATWLLFDPDAHPALRAAYGDDDPALWARAAGWAALFTGIFLEVGADDARFGAVGERALERLRATAGAEVSP